MNTSCRYLIVDDDPAFCAALAHSLARLQQEAVIAYDADAAVRECARFRPQRAILDLKLAESSGLHLIPRLKALDPELHIVVLTGYASVATAVNAIKLGATHYLGKPAGIAEILAAFEDEAPAAPTPPAAIPSLERVEWEHIQRVLDAHSGNIANTARALGMHRRTLQRKLTKRPVKQ
ncbi:MAG: response regulator [Porticoccaceae bacterium]